MSPKPDNTAGAGDRADADVVRAPATAPVAAPASEPVAERRSAPETAPAREEIPGVTIPMPPQEGVTVPPIGGARTAEEAESLALAHAAKDR